MDKLILVVALVLFVQQCHHDACVDNCSTRTFASADEAKVCFLHCKQ